MALAVRITSLQFWNRIRWDARLDPRRFVLGYQERGQERLAEKPFLEWDGTIPWHRVHYFAVDGIRVWDRDQGTDLLGPGELERLAPAPAKEAPPGPPGGFARLQVLHWSQGRWAPVEADAAAPEAPVPFRVATWNVLSDRHDPGLESLERRLQRIFTVLEELDADVIALEEVTPAILALLLARPWVRARYRTSDATGETLEPEGTLLLARVPIDVESHAFANQKRALAARVHVAGVSLDVLALHATSDRARDARRKRARELEAVAARLAAAPERDALVVGDLNARDDDPGGLAALGLVDVWRALRPGEPGFTYDPTRNALTARTSTSGVPARFDRALLRSRGLDAVRIERFGNDERPVSDHDGLVVDLAPLAALDAAPVPTTALALLVPDSLREPIDALRRKHDPAWPRWMPHANLVFGFVPRERFAEAAALVERAVLAASPFEVTLARFDVFEHRSSATVHLVPRCEPPGALEELRARLARRFPGCAGARPFVGHVTVGRFESAAAAREHAARFARDWRPLSFRARSVALIARAGDEPFAVEREVLLGGALESWLRRRGEVESEARVALRERVTSAVLECVRALCPPGVVPGADVHVAGSVRLGVARASSDLDLIATTPPGAPALAPEELAAALGRALGVPARETRGASETVVRFEVEGLPVDVQVAPPVSPAPDSPREPALPVPCREADALRARGEALAPGGGFATVVRALRAWASARLLDAQAWGFPGGLAWARLAAWGLEGAEASETPEELLARVLERASAGPSAASWPEDVRAAARALTPGTRAIVEGELGRAAELARGVLAGEATWDALAAAPDLEGLGAVAWLRVEPRGTAEGEEGRGWLEGAGLGLVLDLERAGRVRPFASRGAGVALGVSSASPGPALASLVEARLERLAADLAREVPGARLAWRVEALSD